MMSVNNNFILACQQGGLEEVKNLIELKADITTGNNLPVRLASYGDHLEIVKFLVESKADIIAEDNQALRWASEDGRLETVKFLLSKGADFSRLSSKHKIYFLTLKVFRRWRLKIFLRKLTQIALPLYYSPGFPGYFEGRKTLENFVQNDFKNPL